MNKFIFALLLLPAFSSSAQTPRCDTLPLAIVNSNILFTTSDWSSFGDYMFTFYIANNHATQGFAYPQAKRDINNKKGRTKCATGRIKLMYFQPPTQRCAYQMVSSGIFPYQINIYCENAQNAQKHVKANISFPR